jgi:hypothetical protein
MVGDVLHADDRGEVEVRVELARKQALVGREVAAAQLEAARVTAAELLEIAEPALLADVDGRDAVARFEQLAHELKTDHTRAAGDEMSHRKIL